VAGTTGVDAGEEQGLVGVNIADSGHNGLVQEQGLDGRPSPLDSVEQVDRCEGIAEGLWSQFAHDRLGVLDKVKTPELALVTIVQPLAIVEVQDDVGMFERLLLRVLQA
jgi:hypothetical protein